MEEELLIEFAGFDAMDTAFWGIFFNIVLAAPRPYLTKEYNLENMDDKCVLIQTLCEEEMKKARYGRNRFKSSLCFL